MATSTNLTKFRRTSAIIAVIGVLLFAVAVFTDAQRSLQAYLVGYVFWWSMSLGCLGLLLLHNLVGGAWGHSVRPYWRATLVTLPLMAVLFIPIALRVEWLYGWATSVRESLGFSDSKLAYLSVTSFRSRATLYFTIWLILAGVAGRKRWAHLRQVTSVARGVSAFGLVLLALTVTFAAIDWIMSLEPKWYSTIFGGIIIADAQLAAIVFSIFCQTQWGFTRGLPNDETRCLHDLGNLLLAFVMLWTYFAFSQYLIIWVGNLPEESGWYLERLRAGWQWILLAVVACHFAVPFLLLLSRDIKRNRTAMLGIALLLLVARFLDMFWIIQPTFHRERIVVPWIDLTVLLGIGGIWVFLFSLSLAQTSRDAELIGKVGSERRESQKPTTG